MKTILSLIFLVLPQLISGYLQHIPNISWLNEYYRNLWRSQDYKQNYFFDFYQPSYQGNQILQKTKLQPVHNYNIEYGGKKHTQIDLSSDSLSLNNLNHIQPNQFLYQSQRNDNNQIPNLPVQLTNLNQIQPQVFYQNQRQEINKVPNPTVQTRAISMTSSDINGFNRGIVTPGSGSLGITKLSNGQFALGSGSLGYGASPVQNTK